MSDGPHWNQDGGPFRASQHPTVAGRERELRALADAVRRLVRVATASDADAETTARAADRIAALAGELESLVPAEPPPRYSRIDGPLEPHDAFPYDVVSGLYNPLAVRAKRSGMGSRRGASAPSALPRMRSYAGPSASRCRPRRPSPSPGVTF